MTRHWVEKAIIIAERDIKCFICVTTAAVTAIRSGFVSFPCLQVRLVYTRSRLSNKENAYSSRCSITSISR